MLAQVVDISLRAIRLGSGPRESRTALRPDTGFFSGQLHSAEEEFPQIVRLRTERGIYAASMFANPSASSSALDNVTVKRPEGRAPASERGIHSASSMAGDISAKGAESPDARKSYIVNRKSPSPRPLALL